MQQIKTLEFAGKEARKFGNSCKWGWWTDCTAFGWQFICSVCSCRATRHQPFSRNRSWHFNCWGPLTGEQLLGQQRGSSSGPSRFLQESWWRGKAMPGPRQRLTGAEFWKPLGENTLKCRGKHCDFPGKQNRLEAGFSGFILIRIKSKLGLQNVAADYS